MLQTVCPIHLEPVGDNLLELKGEITGPPGTPYEGAKFQIEIKIPQDYPFKPPKFRYVTKIWHPNVSLETGTPCLKVTYRNSHTLTSYSMSLPFSYVANILLL